MEIPFPCVPAAFQQWERHSHAFSLEMSPAAEHTTVVAAVIIIIIIIQNL